MMAQAVFTPSSTSLAVTGLQGKKSGISKPDKVLKDAYATVCAIFRQYDKAALLLPFYNAIHDLILPYILLYINTFQFKVSTERDVWTNQVELKSFDTNTNRTRTYPVFFNPFEDMDSVQKVKDDECRALAVSFLEDIEMNRTVKSEENVRDLIRDFGFSMQKETAFKTHFSILR